MNYQPNQPGDVPGEVGNRNPMPHQYYGGAQPDLEGRGIERSPDSLQPDSPDRDPLLYSFGRTELESSTEQDPLVRRSRGHRLYIQQEDSVYSAILFLPAVSRLTTGKETARPARLALLLVLLNALLQIGVVQVIDNYDYMFQRGEVQRLLRPDEVADFLSEHDKPASRHASEAQHESRKALLLPNEKRELDAIRSTIPLCIREGDGSLFCMPHSVKFIYEWKNLDTNSDGLWTLDEAIADARQLKKKLGMSPLTIFNNLIHGLQLSRTTAELRGQNRTFYLSADVDNGKVIPKAYFDYWVGDAMMCALFDSNSCEAAAQAGIFEAALKPGRVSADAKGIYDLDSAIQYCYNMLRPGGACETLLPVEFKLNREQRWGVCGTGSLVEGGKYTNPYAPDQSVHVLKTSYSRAYSYQRSTSRLYLFFQCLIIMLWLLALLDEWRELIKFGEFLIVFPKIQPGTDGGEIIQSKKDGELSYRITALSTKHRAVLVVVFLMRIAVISVLSNFGTRFLINETSYLNLVLNSLALTFVITIDSMLFAMVEKDITEQMKACKKLMFRSYIPNDGLIGYCLKKECWGLFLVPILAVGLVLYFNYRDKEPIYAALKCACYQEGSKCRDSMSSNTEWWQHYWSRVLPAAVHQVEALRIAGK